MTDTLFHQYQQELQALKEAHGISPLILDSLAKSEEEARSAVSFFRKMAFVVNIPLMALAISLLGYGLKTMGNEKLVLGVASLLLGILATIYMCLVWVRQVKAIKAIEQFLRWRTAADDE